MDEIDQIAVRGTMSDVIDHTSGAQRMYYVFDAMLDGVCAEEFQLDSDPQSGGLITLEGEAKLANTKVIIYQILYQYCLCYSQDYYYYSY